MIEILVNVQEAIWTGPCKGANGFRLLLFALSLSFVRNVTLPPLSSISLSGYLGTDLQIIDLAAYTTSARALT